MAFTMPPSGFIGLPPPPTMAPGAFGAGDMLTAKEFPTYGVSPKKNAPDRQPAPIPQLVALLLLPTLVFAATFWLTSFSLRYSSGSAANLLSYCMVLPGLAFFGLSLGASGRERVLSIIIS